MGMTYQQDYILRLIERIAQFVARIAKLQEEEDYDGAQDALDEAFGALLGPERQWIRELDMSTVVMLVSNPDSLKCFARLMEEEGALLDAKAHFPASQQRLENALELWLKTQLLIADGDEESQAAIARLRGKIDPAGVARAYRGVLGNSEQG